MIIPKNPSFSMATRLKFAMMPIVLLCLVVILLVGSCSIEVRAHPVIELGHSYLQNTSLGYIEAERVREERSFSFLEQIITTESSSEAGAPGFGKYLDITDTVLVAGSARIGGFVYEKEGSSWVFRKRLYHTLPEYWTPPSTNGLVIGALVCIFNQDEYSCNGNSGRLLIFERHGGSWNLAQVPLQDVDDLCIREYCSVLVIGSTLSTSIIFVSDATTSTIQLFRKNGDNWEQRQTLSESGRIGKCAAHGDYLVTTNHRTAINGKPKAGAGVLFKLNGNEYEKLINIESPFVSQDEVFGQSVSLNDRWLAVGAFLKVYMFERNGDDFSFSQQQLNSPTACASGICDYAGCVKLSGDLLAVAKHYEPIGGFSFVGNAFIYGFNSDSWELIETLQPSVLQEGLEFSRGLGFAWDVIAVGAPGWDGSNGAIYLESFTRTPVPTPPPTPTATPTPSLSTSPSPSHTPIPNPVTLSPSPSRAPVTETPSSIQDPVTASPSPSHFVVTLTPNPLTSVVPTEPSESQTETPGDDKSSFPIGAVVGGVVGGLLLVGAVAGGIVYYKKKDSAPPVVPDPDDVHYQGIETGEGRTHPIGDDPNMQLDD